MSAPAIRTIIARDVLAGKTCRLEQDKTEVLDYTVDYAGCFGADVVDLDIPTITITPAGFAEAGVTSTLALRAHFTLADAGAVYGDEYRVSVRCGPPVEIGQPTPPQVEVSFTILCKDF